MHASHQKFSIITLTRLIPGVMSHERKYYPFFISVLVGLSQPELFSWKKLEKLFYMTTVKNTLVKMIKLVK